MKNPNFHVPFLKKSTDSDQALNSSSVNQSIEQRINEISDQLIFDKKIPKRESFRDVERKFADKNEIRRRKGREGFKIARRLWGDWILWKTKAKWVESYLCSFITKSEDTCAGEENSRDDGAERRSATKHEFYGELLTTCLKHPCFLGAEDTNQIIWLLLCFVTVKT